MDHDYGFAPNPFWGVMTLATCKGMLRHSGNLEIGDWVIATGGCVLHEYIEHLIFAMRVEKIITFDEYWNTPEFECKKPILMVPLCRCMATMSTILIPKQRRLYKKDVLIP